MTTPTCPVCDRPLVEITIAISGDEVTMRSCTSCDRRSWHSEERGEIELGGVLADLTIETHLKRLGGSYRPPRR